MLTATSFIYDGISSEDFDLMIYYIGDPGVVEEDVWSVEVEEERIPLRQDPFFYGINSNNPTTRELTIGSKTYIDRETVEQILSWLTSHNGYKWLEIEQDDLSDWRYKAIFENIKMVNVNGMPFAFKCTLRLDSQFAYELPTQFSYDVQNGNIIMPSGDSTSSVTLENNSSFNGYLYPITTFQIPIGGSILIENITDNSRLFQLNIPGEYVTNDSNTKAIIIVDNKNQVITCNSDNANIPDLFVDEAGNHYFFRLKQGENVLNFQGTGIVTIECEFLRKVGM